MIISIYCYMFIKYHSNIFFFFFNDTATTEIYTLSLHDALPICCAGAPRAVACKLGGCLCSEWRGASSPTGVRSEEHTSELQSRSDLVCRLLLEKKKNIKILFKHRVMSSKVFVLSLEDHQGVSRH